MILAAGEGRRLRPLTAHLPKALVEVGGRPLIEHAIATAVASGFPEIVVNLHYLGDQIRQRLGDGSRLGARLFYSEERELLGSGGGIVHARALLGDEPFVTLNADTIIDIDLAEVVRAHQRRGAVATMVVRKDPEMGRFGIIGLEADGRVGAILEHHRPSAREPLDPYMYTGVQVLDPRVFAYMPAAGRFSITQHTYPRLLAADELVIGYPFAGAWLTVGTPEELRFAEAALDTPPRSGLS